MKNKICCNGILNIKNLIGWFTYSDDEFQNKLIMPYFFETEPKIRLNYCPSCGAKIRDMEIDPKLLNESKNI